MIREVGANLARDGSFEFPNVAPGEYVIQIYRGRQKRSIEGDFAAQRVIVTGADITNLTLQASSGSLITGRVTLEGGRTLRASDVEIKPEPADPGPRAKMRLTAGPCVRAPAPSW